MRSNKLATFVFNMKGEAEGKTHTLLGVTTGVVEDDGRLTISHLNGGDQLLSPPHADLGATGQFTDEEGKLALTLKTAPATVADGFSGDGSIEATATAPAPQKSKSRTGEDEPM
jgi:hypothetical protein